MNWNILGIVLGVTCIFAGIVSGNWPYVLMSVGYTASQTELFLIKN